MVAIRPSSVLVRWNTTRSLMAPRVREPIQAPSMSEGLAGLCSFLTGAEARLKTSGNSAPCDQVPAIVTPSGASFAFITAVEFFDAEAELGIFDRDRTYGDAVGPGLVDAVEGGCEAAVGSFCDVQYEAQLGSAGAEGSLPVAGDVLGLGEGGGGDQQGRQECESQNAVHLRRPSLGEFFFIDIYYLWRLRRSEPRLYDSI